MKKIIVIGGSDGLGKAIVNLCLNQNLEVINISRTPCDVEGVINIKCDLAIEEDLDNVISIIKKDYN